MQSSPEETANVMPAPTATRVYVTLLDREYSVSCGSGEEPRLQEIATVVDKMLREIAAGNSGISEQRLFMLACLMLADDVLDLRTQGHGTGNVDETGSLTTAIQNLTERVIAINHRVAEMTKDGTN